jgi:hypothetical protein
MNKYLFFFISLFCFLGSIQAQNDSLEIRKTIDGFFTGMHKNDTNQIKLQCCPLPDFKHVSGKTNQFKQESFQGFLNFVGSKNFLDKIEERNTVEEINISGSMAVVWCPYTFYLDGKFEHSGVNSITLIKSDLNGWKICGIIDTRLSK